MPPADVKTKQDGARKVVDEGASRSGAEAEDYAFRIKDTGIMTQQQPVRSINEKGLMVDTGATSHIVTDIKKFKSFNDSYKSETHCVELADGTLCRGVAQRKGDAEVFLIDSKGRRCQTTLRGVLFIPSYPQDIFSVRSATSSGARVIFK